MDSWLLGWADPGLWRSRDSQNVVWVFGPEAEGSYQGAQGAKVTIYIRGKKAGEGRLVVLKSDITIK